MLSEEIIKQIHTIWDNYRYSKNNTSLLLEEPILDIDSKRINAIKDITGLIRGFVNGESNLYEFKSSLDSYNKRNNLWGFTATKGQMFFNQLTKNNENNIENFAKLLKELIAEPRNINDALEKISKLEDYTSEQFNLAKDKRKVANPSSVGYFLSYFWQIHNPEKWPIIYTSLINAFKSLGIWTDSKSQQLDYASFYDLNEEIKKILSSYANEPISNWQAEHAFWNYEGNPHASVKKIAEPKPRPIIPGANVEQLAITEKENVVLKASFNLHDYLIPKVAPLIEIGNCTDKSSAAKGREFEMLVTEVFKFLDFEVEYLGQGTGRNPDAILKYREENTAFIVDAKAYTNGYSLGIDDRAIREYISSICPKLQKEGYKKIGFIIVSNSFKSNLEGFISEITWNTDIRRFILLTSEALLYLFAYKMKDKLPLNVLIDRLISCGNLVNSDNVIEEFDDV